LILLCLRTAFPSLEKLPTPSNADFLPLDDERDTGRVVLNENGTRTFLDFATYRGANLEEDLRARDFTINALALQPA
jgi:hypothetical protein